MKAYLLLLILLSFCTISAEGQNKKSLYSDTDQFVESFSNIAWEEISEELGPAFIEVYKSDTAYVGTINLLFEIVNNYELMNLSFSKDTPTLFHKGIQNALVKTLAYLKDNHKPVITGFVMMPIRIQIFQEHQFLPKATSDAFDGIMDHKPYAKCLILPINRMSYKQ